MIKETLESLPDEPSREENPTGQSTKEIRKKMKRKGSVISKEEDSLSKELIQKVMSID